MLYITSAFKIHEKCSYQMNYTSSWLFIKSTYALKKIHVRQSVRKYHTIM